MTPDLLLREAALRSARLHLEPFVRLTMPEFTFGWFNQLLCRVLEDFYEEVMLGNSPRYMIFAPPRSGKSEIVSRRFPAWLLGVNPKTNIISTSYSAELASRNSRDVQRVIEHPMYSEIFPNTKLPGRRTEGVNTSLLWEPVNRHGKIHGSHYTAAGVGGGISGMGFRIGLIDDPVKDYAEASSKILQEDIWEWYQTTFRTRRDPLINGILLIQTRWHRHDLSGKLIAEASQTTGEKWTIFSFPMECEESIERVQVGGKTYKTRKKGDILFPERMPQEFVKSCKTSPLTWNALYQQRPTVEGGNFFKSTWWDFYDRLPNPFETMIITADTAQKTGEENDYTVFQIWGKKEGRIYLVDQVRGKYESPDLIRTATAIWQEWGGGVKGPRVNASSFFVEDKASGTGLIQDLRSKGIPVIGIPRTKDKVTRAVDKQSRFAAGLVVLPRYKPWLTEFLMEFEDFSLLMTHSHDDQVDAALDAVDILLDNGGGLNYGGMRA